MILKIYVLEVSEIAKGKNADDVVSGPGDRQSQSIC